MKFIDYFTQFVLCACKNLFVCMNVRFTSMYNIGCVLFACLEDNRSDSDSVERPRINGAGKMKYCKLMGNSMF